MFKLLIAFARLSFADLLLKAQGIKVALTSEPALTLFPNPWPAVYPSRTALTTADKSESRAGPRCSLILRRPRFALHCRHD